MRTMPASIKLRGPPWPEKRRGRSQILCQRGSRRRVTNPHGARLSVFRQPTPLSARLGLPLPKAVLACTLLAHETPIPEEILPSATFPIAEPAGFTLIPTLPFLFATLFRNSVRSRLVIPTFALLLELLPLITQSVPASIPLSVLLELMLAV